MEDQPKRKPMRMKEYDYAQAGAYHVTICTKDHACVLSRIVGEGLCVLPEVSLTSIGRCVEESIRFLSAEWDAITVEGYVIMPNHVHLLIRIDRTGGRGGPPLHEVIRRLKSYTTYRYGRTLWQRSYYDHIIRGQQDYDETLQYIQNNPLRWVMRQREEV